MKLVIIMVYVGFWIDFREDVWGYSVLLWVWDIEVVIKVLVRVEVSVGCWLFGYF